MVIGNRNFPFVLAELARNNWKGYGLENIKYHIPCEHK